jgi:hypothetical protein
MKFSLNHIRSLVAGLALAAFLAAGLYASSAAVTHPQPMHSTVQVAEGQETHGGASARLA